MPLDANPDLPRFQQVRLILRDRIRSGYYETGMPLPGERQLAEEFGVARNAGLRRSHKNCGKPTLSSLHDSRR
jgi:DNA-binding GntR family transcriptional regulator